MKALAALALAAVLVVSAVLVWSSVDSVERERRAAAALYEHQRTQLALERERLALQQAHQSADVVSVLDVLYRALPLVMTALALYTAHDAYKQRRTPLVRPDARGLLPVARTQLERSEVVEIVNTVLLAYHETQHTRALTTPQAVPHTFSPHMTVTAPMHAQPAQQVTTRQDEQSAQPATLPERVELADVLNRVKQGSLAFGVTSDGALLQRPLAQCYHALFAGDTRSGKTNGLDSLIVQLHHMRTHQRITLYACDYKQELLATWSRSALFQHGILSDPHDIAHLLDELVRGAGGVQARYRTFERIGAERHRVVRNIGEYAQVTGRTASLAVLVLDEINALLEAARKSDAVTCNLKTLLQTGAGAGIYVLGGAQYLTAQVLGRDASKQFVSRALFGAYDSTAARMMFDSLSKGGAQSFVDARPGRGLVRLVGMTAPAVFQSLHCSEQDILNYIALLRAHNDTTQPETHETSFKSLETHETSFNEHSEIAQHVTPEIAHIVQRLREQGKGKTAIIELVWNAKPGGTEAYKHASKVYDAITQADA